jgi:hypothetical protein
MHTGDYDVPAQQNPAEPPLLEQQSFSSQLALDLSLSYHA